MLEAAHAQEPPCPPEARRRSRHALIAAAVGWLWIACSPVAPQRSAPNLLLITVDTLRADRLACYGGESDVGTAICALADSGTRFQWAFSAAPYTAPSIASVLTSQYPFEHGVRQSAISYLAEEAVTLAEVLKQHGYATAAVVSNPVLDRNRHLQQGFDVYDQRMTRRERNRSDFEEREAQSTTDAAIAWAQVGAEPPWFLWVHFQDPHGPYEPPEPAASRPAPGSPLPILEDNSGLGGIPSYQQLPGLLDFASYSARYTDEIRYLDDHLGRLIERLDAMGPPPAVLLTADHGEALGEDGYYFAHGHSVGLDQIRVPLLWRPATPGTPRVWTGAVGALDIAPTLLRAAGIDPPDAFRGAPLPTTDSDDDSEAQRLVYAEHGRRAAVMQGDAYFGRDRWTIASGTRDRTSGGILPGLPARFSRLAADGAAPSYSTELGALGPELEQRLAAFIERAAAHKGPREERAGSVPATERERLRALGYLD